MNTASIFISHASGDNVFCHKLFGFLKQELPNSDIFYDENELTAGDEWIRRIQHEVLKRPLFIVVLSPRSVVAEWVRNEPHQVTVSGFIIAKYPVTVAEYACARRVRTVPEPAQIGDITWMLQLTRLDHPVIGVSWKGTLAYVSWLSKITLSHVLHCLF